MDEWQAPEPPPLENADLLREVEGATKRHEIFDWAMGLSYEEYLAIKPMVEFLRTGATFGV